jgi:hypothetical protein
MAHEANSGITAHLGFVPCDHNQSEQEVLINYETIIEEIPLGDFRQLIPQALIDIELPEDHPKYHQAAQVILDQPEPPAMPFFLYKNVLNGNISPPDNSSLLGLPNYTTLHHLATTKLQKGILALSVTIRYREKVEVFRHCDT